MSGGNYSAGFSCLLEYIAKQQFEKVKNHSNNSDLKLLAEGLNLLTSQLDRELSEIKRKLQTIKSRT